MPENKTFLQANFKGKPKNALVSVSKLVHGMYHSCIVWNSHLYSISTSGLTPRNVTLSRRRIESKDVLKQCSVSLSTP